MLALPVEAFEGLHETAAAPAVPFVTHFCATSTNAGAVAIELTWFSV